ncbi:DUF4198 domain-containing protein [uncultured Desulfobacter sp.]|uniref:DUF4198 domain-containing protein n=1 Tax=uncultured Desulfobacter sp. TaxID=240139 RepID=UPI002AA673A0|nr:DUF4198 domain-containing protein [uncultured Desulfobacter sp.]
MKKILFSLFLLGCSASFAHAHMFWVNVFESDAHQPPHAMVSMGWGHTLPMDDILTDPNSARIGVEKLELYDPALKKTDLIKIKSKITEAEVTNEHFDIFPADLAAQKIALKKDSLPGVYQIGAISKATCYTHYIDNKGRYRIKHKSKDELDNIKEIKGSLKNQSFAKAYITLGKWTNPKPLGHKLEIIPLTDLSNVHVGDMVGVKVLFYGEPQSTSLKNNIYITAGSNTFGLDEGFNLQSFLVEGKAQFRVQSKGQWIINTMKGEDVTKDGKLKDLYGKVDTVYHTASLTFNVK